MTLPFPLPDWLPWWVPLVVLIPVLLYIAVFLLMPFSVFGVKGRLDLIDARLDEIQGEIRMLTLRLPSGPSGEAPGQRPPVAPAPPPPRHLQEPTEDADDDRPPPRRPQGRAEPRFDWPR